jgi:hypothetical protein
MGNRGSRVRPDSSKPGEKPTKQAANRQAASAKSSGNTAQAIYLDTFNKATICASDKDSIEKACKGEEAKKDTQSQKKNAKPRGARAKLGALADKVEAAVHGLDDGGKTYNRYTPNADNQWMADHCDGMWVSPAGANINKLVDKVKEGINADIAALVKEAGGKIVDLGAEAAKDYAGKAAIRQGVGIASLVVPLGGEVILAGVTIWNIADGVWTATTTAVELVGKAKEAYDKISVLKDQLGTLDKVLDKGVKELSGADIWGDIMAAAAEVNPCLRARKCQFVPYEETKAGPYGTARNGKGCCPGQTGHHVIPDSAVKSNCKGYSEGGSPVICMEGATQYHGSHGVAHTALGESMEKYNGGEGKPPKDISYKEMKKQALKAIQPFTLGCNPKCLEAQLDNYYKDCEFTSNSGKGGGGPGSTGTSNTR